MKKPEKKEILPLATDYRSVKTQPYLAGYNQACDDWEKWLKEKDNHIYNLRCIKCGMDLSQFKDTYTHAC